jgi:anti-sigma B factor antagonist
MSMPSATLKIGLFDHCVCVKVCGRANFVSGLDLKSVVARLAGQGYDHFILDLRDCLMMDSTFLGVLSGIGLQYIAPTNHPVSLISPPQRIRELLESLGVSHLFKFFEQEPVQTDKLEPLRKEDASRAEITRTCLEAHKLLMAVNPENVNRFKDVTRFLAEDLKKQEEAESNKPAAITEKTTDS